MRLKLSTCMMLLFISCVSFAQSKKTSLIKGTLVNSATKTGYNNLKIIIPDLNVFTSSDGDGNFSIAEVPYGTQTLIITGISAKSDTLKLTIDKPITNLGNINITPSDNGPSSEANIIPTIAIEENLINPEDDGVSSSNQSSGGMFVSTQDPFLYTAVNFNNQFRFQPRGFNLYELQVNGIQVHDFERGITSWSQLGGLNDVLHGRNETYGLKPSDFSYGALTTTTYLDATAADQRKGNTATYTLTDRNYRNRAMFTHNSGLMKNGWAYSVSASHRWANEGYVKGTFYDGYSFYGGVSKVINKSQFNLTTIGAPTKRGGASFASTEEVYQLAKDNQYNDAWGYQNGKVRNAKVTDVFQPIVIANYTYKPSDRTRWNTSLGYEFGKYKSSTLDGYNSSSPYPDYYRNLPSYYLTFNPPELSAANAIKTQFQNHPELLQINWDELYNSNYINTETIKNVNGITGNDVTGRRSMYVVSNYVDDQKTLNFNSNVEHAQNEHLVLYGGINATSQNDEYYKQLTDLMGGDFFVNYNQFATQQTVAVPGSAQNDLNHPNQLIKVGDRYGFDYKLHLIQSQVWGQAAFTFNKFDFFTAADGGYTSFSREGLMKNGLFPNNSYGSSPSQNFLTPKIKAGITYKFDLRNFIFLNVEYREEAPAIANTYISVATRDFVIDHPANTKIKTMECGYLLKSPTFNAKITGYLSDFSDLTNILRFYNDDPSILSFVNFVVNNVSARSIGTELSGVLRMDKEWSLTGVASVGSTYYTNSPMVTIYQDNDPAMTSKAHKVYIKNYYVGNGPQSIYSIGARYQPKKEWTGNIHLNYLDRSYVGINPDRRTPTAIDLVPYGSAQWKAITAQEKLPAAYTVDLSGGKSFNLGKYTKSKHRTSLNCNIGISNLLNKTDIKTTGYEQLRFDYTYHNSDKFPNKYDYAYGINFFANIVLRF